MKPGKKTKTLFSLSELIQLNRDFCQIWPTDLLEDLEEKEPQLFQEYRQLQILTEKAIREAEKKDRDFLRSVGVISTLPERPSSPFASSQPSLISFGWDEIHPRKTNWADFQNLLFFYALGKLHLAETDERRPQKEADLAELRWAIEGLSLIKKAKPQTAEERVAQRTSYLLFGKKMIDALMMRNEEALYDCDREIQDAEETNSYNARKLKHTRFLAAKVVRTLKNRYSLGN